LADALTGPGGESQPVSWVSGALVTAVATTSTPHTVTIRLPDGTVVDTVPFLGWWAPTVDARVEVIRRGTSLLVLGPVAPAPLATVTAPAPLTPPPAPDAPSTRRTATVQPIDMGTWDPDGSYWTNVMTQGGPTGKRALWFYGDGITVAKGTGSIVAASVCVKRLSTEHGVTGDADVMLGVHHYALRPATVGGPLVSAARRAGLRRGKDANVTLNTAQLAELNAGALGLGLDAGTTAYDDVDYLRVTADAPSGALALIIEG
jgi:hypothetical protein